MIYEIVAGAGAVVGLIRGITKSKKSKPLRKDGKPELKVVRKELQE